MLFRTKNLVNEILRARAVSFTITFQSARCASCRRLFTLQDRFLTLTQQGVSCKVKKLQLFKALLFYNSVSIIYGKILFFSHIDIKILGLVMFPYFVEKIIGSAFSKFSCVRSIPCQISNNF